MAHRGQRSDEAQQRRMAKRYILDNSFIDILRKEVVGLIEPSAVKAYMGHFFMLPDPNNIPEVFPGLVLQDEYGTGAFQEKCPIIRFR